MEMPLAHLRGGTMLLIEGEEKGSEVALGECL